MAKQQRIMRKDSSKKQPQVFDNRSQVSHSPVPIRTVLFVEVGDMSSDRVAQLVQQVRINYTNAAGGIHYILPIRHGKIGSDMVFEKEWEDIVRQTCTVNEHGQIVLKDGAKEVNVVREVV